MKTRNIYLDMDGVMCNFVGAACKVHNKPVSVADCWQFFEKWGLTAKEFWDPIHERGVGFWATLDILPWAKDLYEQAKSLGNVVFLTSPCVPDCGCKAGKLKWLRTMLDKSLGQNDVIFCSGGVDKHDFAEEGDILIDDLEGNIASWRAHGGIGILFPQPWNEGFRLKEWGCPYSDHVEGILDAVCTTEDEVQDGDMVTNAAGGKQSHVAARLDLIPPENLLLLGECLGFGANKYGVDNWQRISERENLNHAMVHLTKWLSGDREEPHLVNTLARVNFALHHAIVNGEQEKKYLHPDMI